MSLDLALIGGTGLYHFPGMENAERHALPTPFGVPSGPVVTGNLNGRKLAFIARHGEKHTIAPHRVNYRANLWALQRLGARRIVGINAVGGIRADMGPRAIVVPHQIIDYTHGRYASFCDAEGVEVRHVDFSEPYTESLRLALIGAAERIGISIVRDGVYGATQGPRLETVAEIARMQRDGCDLVGMTGMPEAVLARELGMEYACLALVANWAAGCGGQTMIGMDEILSNLDAARGLVPDLIRTLLDIPLD